MDRNKAKWTAKILPESGADFPVRMRNSAIYRGKGVHEKYNKIFFNSELNHPIGGRGTKEHAQGSITLCSSRQLSGE